MITGRSFQQAGDTRGTRHTGISASCLSFPASRTCSVRFLPRSRSLVYIFYYIQTSAHNIATSGLVVACKQPLIYCISCCVFIDKTGRRLSIRLREHRLDTIKRKVAFPVRSCFARPDHRLEDMSVAVPRAGLAEQNRKKRE